MAVETPSAVAGLAPLRYSQRYVSIWLTLLLLIAAFIRVDGAGDFHYSADEVMHYYLSKGSAVQVMRSSLSETHPPVGNLLRHYWGTNNSPSYMRSQGLIFSLALIVLYYAIGKQLGGTFAGMCCAALTAFSYGAIVQSYILRNYAFFLVFLSAAFYFYLRWRENRGTAFLFGYTLFGALACLTHFSGIFAIFSIALYETVILKIKKQPLQLILQWMLANATIALTFIIIFATWYNAVARSLEVYLHSMLPADLWKYSLIFPEGVISYALPYRNITHYSSCMFLGMMLLVLFACRRNFSFSPLLTLTLVAFAVGTGLFATRYYPFPGGRHSLWIFPFIITATGWALADMVERGAGMLTKPAFVLPALPFLLILPGWPLYSPSERFADRDEYAIRERDWQALTQVLGSLDASNLIIADRGDMFLLDIPRYNPYRDADHATVATAQASAIMVHYGKTHMLYNSMRTHVSDEMLLAIAQQAQKTQLLAHVDTLVFVQSAWSSHIWTPIVNLMLCDDLDKQVLAFPASAPSHALTRADIFDKGAVLLFVSKKAFFEQALAPNGKAHHCLNE